MAIIDLLAQLLENKSLCESFLKISFQKIKSSV